MSEPTRAMIESRTDFQNAVRGAFAEAALVGCREIWLVDDDFADWPLGERAVVDDPDALGLGAPQLQRRGAQLRRDRAPSCAGSTGGQFSHVVHCRSNSDLEAGQMPTILLVPGLLSVRLHDACALPRRGHARARRRGAVARGN